MVPDGAVQDLKKRNESLQSEYSNVVEENENLRIGMHEILAKLRDYDGEFFFFRLKSLLKLN